MLRAGYSVWCQLSRSLLLFVHSVQMECPRAGVDILSIWVELSWNWAVLVLDKWWLFSLIHLFSFAINFSYQILFCRTFLIFPKLHRMRRICCFLRESAPKGWAPGSQGQMGGGRGLLDLCTTFPTASSLESITHGSNTPCPHTSASSFQNGMH